MFRAPRRPDCTHARTTLGALALALAVALAGCGTSTGSIGAVIGRDNQTAALHIRDAPPGLGAAKAGLRPGDEIVMIEGFYVKNLNGKQIQTLLRGDPGTAVELTVVRGESVRRVKVTRSPLREKKVEKPQQSSGRIE